MSARELSGCALPSLTRLPSDVGSRSITNPSKRPCSVNLHGTEGCIIPKESAIAPFSFTTLPSPAMTSGAGNLPPLSPQSMIPSSPSSASPLSSDKYPVIRPNRNSATTLNALQMTPSCSNTGMSSLLSWPEPRSPATVSMTQAESEYISLSAVAPSFSQSPQTHSPSQSTTKAHLIKHHSSSTRLVYDLGLDRFIPTEVEREMADEILFEEHEEVPHMGCDDSSNEGTSASYSVSQYQYPALSPLMPELNGHHQLTLPQRQVSTDISPGTSAISSAGSSPETFSHHLPPVVNSPPTDGDEEYYPSCDECHGGNNNNIEGRVEGLRVCPMNSPSTRSGFTSKRGSFSSEDESSANGRTPEQQAEHQQRRSHRRRDTGSMIDLQGMGSFIAAQLRHRPCLRLHASLPGEGAHAPVLVASALPVHVQVKIKRERHAQRAANTLKGRRGSTSNPNSPLKGSLQQPNRRPLSSSPNQSLTQTDFEKEGIIQRQHQYSMQYPPNQRRHNSTEFDSSLFSSNQSPLSQPSQYLCAPVQSNPYQMRTSESRNTAPSNNGILPQLKHHSRSYSTGFPA
jgi:hypothetical protein